ncbi:MAG TPA: MarR family transcriptional regulator, partial [Thermoprotei archaeon]|nr:MarR family transcriptional regulator [Thermoprotei archaeon]
VIDGIDRIRIEESIIIFKDPSIISFIKIDGISPIHSRLYRKVKLAEELIEMPPSAKLVFKVLEYEGPLTQKDIVEKTFLPSRTVRYALNILSKRGLIKDIPNLRDARQKLYYTNI